MQIKIVMGIPCAGKSTFIKNNFPDYTIIDLYDYQKNTWPSVDNIMKSYEDARDALILAIKNNEDVVLEHTLLKACRREMYIQAIREVTDAPIDIYVINPNVTKVKSHAKKRGINKTKENILYEKEILEIPTLDEGFNSIKIIKNNKDYIIKKE